MMATYCSVEILFKDPTADPRNMYRDCNIGHIYMSTTVDFTELSCSEDVKLINDNDGYSG